MPNVTETGLVLAEKLWGWVPHSDGQRDFLTCDAKVVTAACGRRWGKSESCAIDIAMFALSHPQSTQFIVAPTDDQTKIIMGEVSRRLGSVPGLASEIREVKAPHWNLVMLDAKGFQSGTTVKARTAGSTGRGIRGNKAHRVVVDEAAFVVDSIYDDAVSPLLADYDGTMVKISTPCGRNHFWREYIMGLDPLQARYRSFSFPSSSNPYLPKAYLEDQERNKPDRTWRQEYLAEFLDDAGGVFRDVLNVIDQRVTDRKGVGEHIGVDLARVQDFTVVSVMDGKGNQLEMHRVNQVSWDRQIALIRDVASRHPKAKVWLDSTGVGDPIYEALRMAGVHVEGYQLTNQSKEDLINNLALLIERARVRLLDVPQQTAELQAYAYEITASRSIRMNAPAGQHDDCVIALALAAWDLRERKAQAWGFL